MKINVTVAMLVAFLLQFTALADAVKGFPVDTSTLPVVPNQILVQGRQKVTEYLLFQVDHVDLNYSGVSLVRGYANDQRLDRVALRNLGYINAGSFSELSDSIAMFPFSAKVVPTPDGWYDVRVSVSLSSSDNRELFMGGGNLGIGRDVSTGRLVVSSFSPWVNLNSQIVSRFTNTTIVAAQWVGHNNNSIDLTVGGSWDNADDSDVVIPVGLLNDGYFLVADSNGGLFGWDLSSGAQITGQRIMTVLGQISSGDVKVLRNPASIDNNVVNTQFYNSDGRIYGRVPLLDVVLSTNMKDIFNVQVPVWGSSHGISPSGVFVTPIRLMAPQPVGGWTVGQEYKLDSFPSGGFIINVPAGEYHIRLDFDKLLDWDADPSPKG
jgi:hypothetical protein